MPLGLIAFVAWILFVTLTGAVLLVWGWRRGQFRDVEAPKFTMLEDREPEPWPGRKDGTK